MSLQRDHEKLLRDWTEAVEKNHTLVEQATQAERAEEYEREKKVLARKALARANEELAIAKDTRDRAQAAANRELERRRDVEQRLAHYVMRYKPIEEALAHARRKHPSSQHRALALMEEMGELAEAWFEHGQHSREARMEAYQVIATVLRIIEEKDPTGP